MLWWSYPCGSACDGASPAVTRTAWDTANRTPCAGHSPTPGGCPVPLHHEPSAPWSEPPSSCCQVLLLQLCPQSWQSLRGRCRRGSCHGAGSSRRRELLSCVEDSSAENQTRHHTGSTWTEGRLRAPWDDAAASFDSRRPANTASTRWCDPHCSCLSLGSCVTEVTQNSTCRSAAARQTLPLSASTMHSPQNLTWPPTSLLPPPLHPQSSFPDSHHQCCQRRSRLQTLPASHNRQKQRNIKYWLSWPHIPCFDTFI